MKLTADYHTHTVFSHGTGRVDDNVSAAIDRGLTAVGIADHSIAHYAYGVRRRRMADYLAAIDDAKQAYVGRVAVKAGIELNLVALDGRVDMPSGAFDVVILGYHKAVLYKNLRTAWRLYTGYTRFGRPDEITQAYIAAMRKYRINIIAHPGYGVPVNYRLLGQACADYGALFEINNKHTELTVEAIHEVAAAGARFVISSDAHAPKDVGQASRALALAKKAGLGSGQLDNAVED
jgi:putative hydrolase